MARVFISYRHVRPDEDIARALHRRLSDLDHDVFLDAADIPVGAPWDKHIQENIRRAEWFVALVSSSYLFSDYIVNTELALAAERLRGGTLAGIAPVNVAFAGDYPDKVSKLLGDIQQAMWRGAGDTPAVLDRLAELIPRPQVLVKGMRAFQPTDAPRFPALGREADVDRFMARLGESTGVVLLHGVSGSGKSSFLNAGILPRLTAGKVELRRADAADPPAFPPPAEGTTWTIIDQVEQWLVPLGQKPEEAARLGREIIAWLAGSAERRVILSIRDEYRTPFDALLPDLARDAVTFALLPFAPPTAGRVLRLLLDDANVDRDDTFIDALCVELAAGTPPAVRPALLQLIAQEARHFGQRLDRAGWTRAAHGSRSFFEAHLRRTVLDPLPPRISRVTAAGALRGLTAGELKSSPRTAAEIAADEKLPAPAVEKALAMAALPHARVASVEETPAGSPRYQLVHDLFAAAANSVHREEQRERQLWIRRAVITALSLLLAAAAALGGVALVQLQRAERATRVATDRTAEAELQRGKAEQQTRRALSASLAALAQTSLDESPPRSLLYAVEGLRRAPAGEGWLAEHALRTALGESGGIHLPAHAGGGLALSSDGRWAANHELFAIALWDLGAYPPVARRWEVGPATAPLAFSAGDRWLVELERQVTLWPLKESGKGVTLDVELAALERGGARLCGVRGREVVTWDLQAPDPAASPTVVGDAGAGKVLEIACAPGRVALHHGEAVQVFGSPGSPPRRLRDPRDEPYSIPHLTFSPDGSHLASWSSFTSEPRAVRVWDLRMAADQPATAILGDRLIHLDIRDEGDVSALRDNNEQVRWRPSDGRGPGPAFPGLPIFAGQQVQDRWAWDPAPGGWMMVDRALDAIPLRVGGRVHSVAFSADGRFIGVDSDTGARVWDLHAQHPNAADSLLHLAGLGHEIRFSHAISWMFDISDDGTALWRIEPGSPPRRAGFVKVALDARRELSVSFSKDDRYAVTQVREGAGMRSLLWSLDETAKEIVPVDLDASAGASTWVELSPTGEHVAISSRSSRVVRLRSLDGAGAERDLAPAEAGLATAVFSLDGESLLGATTGGAMFVWSIAEIDAKPTKLACPRPAETFGVTPSDRFWIAQSEQGPLCLVAREDLRVQELAGAHTVAAYSRDGAALLARAFERNTLDLWDLRAGDARRIRRIDASGDAQFSPDGRWLFVARPRFGDLGALLFDLRSGGDPHELSIPDEDLRGAFSADGRWLAAADRNWTVLWRLDGAAPERIATIPAGNHAAQGCLAFRPDSAQLAIHAGEETALVALSSRGVEHTVMIGMRSHQGCWYVRGGKYLVGAPDNGGPEIWAADRAALEEAARRVVGRNLTETEWRDAFGDEPPRTTFPDLP